MHWGKLNARQSSDTSALFLLSLALIIKWEEVTLCCDVLLYIFLVLFVYYECFFSDIMKYMHSILDIIIHIWNKNYHSVQFSSVTQSRPTLWHPMDCSTPGLPVHHQLPEFTQTHIHRVSDAIQSSHPPSSPSPLASNPSQHQRLFQWVNSSREVAKGLEFQL